jgi:amidase
MAPSLDHVGCLARTVADAAIMFDAIAGFDPQDPTPTSLNERPPNVLVQMDQGIRNIRIGLDRTYALKGVDSGQAAALEDAVKVLESPGAQIVEVKISACPVGSRRRASLTAFSSSS